MTKSKIFIGLVLAFTLGIYLGSRAGLENIYVYIALALAISLFAINIQARHNAWRLIALFFIALLLGIIRINVAGVANEFENIFGSKRQLEGYIVEDPDVRENMQMLVFKPKGFGQRLLITTTKYQEYSYGDWVVAEGKVVEPKEFDGFDYPKYLERQNIYGQIKYPKILILKDKQGNWLKEQLLDIKHGFARRINRVLPEPQSSLLLGILVGARKSLPQTVTEDFQAVGLSHIIAVSGYNISIIIVSLGGFLARLLGRRASFWASLLVISGFAIISGASASVLRASLMGAALLLSFNIGRLYSIGPAMSLAAAAMLAANPKILYWDVGFQLSFLATLGIVLLVPEAERLTPDWPNWLNLKTTLFTTLAAILATLPLILLNFERLSTVAPLANLLVVPFIPAIMLFGFLSFLPVVGPGFALIANWLLSYVLKISAYLAGLPYANIEMHITGLMALMLMLAAAGLYGLLRLGSLRLKKAPVYDKI